MARSEDRAHVVERIPRRGAECVFVGTDGVDGAGKTTFADELAELIPRRSFGSLWTTSTTGST